MERSLLKAAVANRLHSKSASLLLDTQSSVCLHRPCRYSLSLREDQVAKATLNACKFFFVFFPLTTMDCIKVGGVGQLCPKAPDRKDTEDEEDHLSSL